MQEHVEVGPELLVLLDGDLAQQDERHLSTRQVDPGWFWGWIRVQSVGMPSVPGAVMPAGVQGRGTGPFYPWLTVSSRSRPSSRPVRCAGPPPTRQQSWWTRPPTAQTCATGTGPWPRSSGWRWCSGTPGSVGGRVCATLRASRQESRTQGTGRCRTTPHPTRPKPRLGRLRGGRCARVQGGVLLLDLLLQLVGQVLDGLPRRDARQEKRRLLPRPERRQLGCRRCEGGEGIVEECEGEDDAKETPGVNGRPCHLQRSQVQPHKHYIHPSGGSPAGSC